MSNNSKALVTERSKAVAYELPLIKEGENLLVDAQILHKNLQVKTKFEDWISRRIKEFGFEENKDYFSNLRIRSDQKAGKRRKEILLTLDMCKELGMVEKTAQGRAIRRYFIEAEKELHNKRLYGQKMNLTQLRQKVEARRVNGYVLYPLRQVQELLGYSTKTSVGNVRRGFAGLLIIMDNKAWVAEQYVQVMVARATARAKTLEAKATQPVLPLGFGEQTLFTNPKTHA